MVHLKGALYSRSPIPSLTPADSDPPPPPSDNRGLNWSDRVSGKGGGGLSGNGFRPAELSGPCPRRSLDISGCRSQVLKLNQISCAILAKFMFIVSTNVPKSNFKTGFRYSKQPWIAGLLWGAWTCFVFQQVSGEASWKSLKKSGQKRWMRNDSTPRWVFWRLVAGLESFGLVRGLDFQNHVFFLFLRRFNERKRRDWIPSVSGVSIDRVESQDVLNPRCSSSSLGGFWWGFCWV